MELPTDISACHNEIARLHNLLESKDSHQRIISLERENTYLKEKLRLTQMKLWGRSSERRAPESSPAQILLFAPETVEATKPEKKERITYERTKRRKVEGKLPEGIRFPEHLPRKEEIIDEGEGEVVFTKITERLAAERNPFYVKRLVRNIRKIDGSLKSPAVPPAVIERTAVDASFLVYLIVAKYVWHLPLYRQEQILKAQGITISRDTLIRYVISVAELLKPIYVALGMGLFESSHLFADESPVQVGKIRDGLKRYSESYFWSFLGELGCAFYYTPTRAFKEVDPLIKNFKGKLQSDGYRVYQTISRKFPEIILVGCWAHVRRKFIEAEQGGNPKLATEALRYIRVLYRVERWIKDEALKPPDILRLRRRHSRKVLSLFHSWLKDRRSDPALLPNSLIGVALHYAIKRWESLCRYIDDHRLAIDSNVIEREFRPLVIGKKNWLFCASEVGAEASAILYSLIASCRLADVDPWDYLSDVLERISEHPANRVAELIPVNWKILVENEAAQQVPTQQQVA